MAVESFELFRRIATDAMATLDLPPVRLAHSASAPAASAHP